jgi:hypothetical protein
LDTAESRQREGAKPLWPIKLAHDAKGEAMSEQNRERAYIAAQIQQAARSHQFGQKLWSFASNGSTILVIVLSALAAVLTQITSDLHSIPTRNIVTLLSLAVTILSTVQSRLGFERKWIANRMTRSSLRQLEIDEKTGASLPDLVAALKSILSRHDQAIVGIGSSPGQPGAPVTSETRR